MPTGDKHVEIYNKQLVPQTGWNAYFFKYLDAKADAATRAAFLSAGVLSDQIIGLTSTADDTWEVDISNASRGVDDSGHIMDLALAEPDEIEDIAFENQDTIDYFTGFRYQSVPDGIERNPRSAEPEYPWKRETIGELGDPDSITDFGTYLRIQIDGILEAGVNHKDRPVRVWLDNPVSPVLGVAYWDGVVSWDGNNVIFLNYTASAGPLGQTAPTFPISLTASDYTVHVRGLSWFRNTDISTDGNYVYLGTVEGAGAGITPTVFDTTGQNSAFLISLQRAYYGNAATDPAPGRTIWAHRKAVRIRQSASTVYEQDFANAALWIDKQDETVDTSVGIAKFHSESLTTFSVPDLNLRSLNDGTGNDLQNLEAATITGNTITLTRGGVDLVTKFADIFKSRAWVLIENSTSNLQDALYLVTGTTTNTITVVDMDLATPTWPADNCNVRVFYTISMNLYKSALDPTYSDYGGSLQTISKSGDGLELQMLGAPLDDNKFMKVGATDGGKLNLFYSLVAGRVWMIGGGSAVNKSLMEGEVRGWAQYQSDKRETGELGTNWVPAEASGEWGFDYRGQDFGKDTTTDAPGNQISASFRQPLTKYDGGSTPLLSEEPFSSTSANQLNFTRVGFDNAMVPAFNAADGGRAWVMAEVQFDTPHATDGIYFVQSQVGGTTLAFQTVNGNSPGFPTSQTGVCRFYGGAFFGTHSADYGGMSGWVQTIVPPTNLSGGTRMIFDGEDSISSTEYRWASLIHGYGAALQMWGVRDGGVMFSRAITTRAWEGGHELTQWDQVDTALVNTDQVVSDLYTGTLAQIDEIDLVEGTYDLTLPSTQANCNVFKQDGGGTWSSVNKILNIFKMVSSISAGTIAWHTATGAAYMTCTAADVGGKIPIKLPQGATLNSVSLYIDPITGDGTAASFGAELLRKTHSSTSATTLMSGGMSYTNTATVHNFTITANQNNDIDNSSYTYWVEVRSSDTAGDFLYSARCNYDIDLFGEHFFDCF